MNARDVAWMESALEAAERARALDEVPVGAVLVIDDRLIVAAHNTREIDRDPTAHAEVLALRRAARLLGRWRLDDATLYVTLEPCSMCAGALVHARLGRLVYGADDARAGAVRSLFRLVDDPRLNHRVPVTPGVLAERSAALLRGYFKAKRPDPSVDRFEIRAARPGDEVGLQRVAVSVVRAAWADHRPEADVEARVRIEKSRDWDCVIERVFVATRRPSGAIVGYAIVDDETRLEAAVLRELRGRGLGRRLLEAAIEGARARGVKALRASVAREDEASRNFLEAMGAEKIAAAHEVPGLMGAGAYLLDLSQELKRRERDSPT